MDAVAWGRGPPSAVDQTLEKGVIPEPGWLQIRRVSAMGLRLRLERSRR